MAALDSTHLDTSNQVDPQAFVRIADGQSRLDLLVRGAVCAGRADVDVYCLY